MAGAFSGAPCLVGWQECYSDSTMEGQWKGFCCK